ncbi:MAG: N-6 DNA methylase [Cytophagales bacterium]|nr:N-6 DNA methylase [Cytophagales bacterium]
MLNNKTIQPFTDELPSHYADKLGIDYACSVTQEHKKEKGQFFTPIEIASLMASFSECNDESIRILDPGCGTAILTCALIEYLAENNKNLRIIEIIVYETDSVLVPYAEKSLEYLQNWIEKKGIILQYLLHIKDYVLANADCLNENADLFSKKVEPFDIIISNPPYFKLSIEDKRTKAAKVVVNGHPNIYAMFMAISGRLLKENGELIFITPRSYASGNYFKTFREFFFNLIDLEKVHLFASRKDTFNRDKVLQETVIIKGTRRKNTDKNNGQVVVSSSNGLKDITIPQTKSFLQKELIDIATNGKFLYLPTNDFEESILHIFKDWEGNLIKYNIQISTGPVVAFRARNYIQDNYKNDSISLAPLFWLHNVKQMILEWPIPKPNKGQYVLIQDETNPILIPNKNYILLRRFSSKDDKNRLIAAPYFCNYLKADFIGVENKVNYIYRPNGHLERNEVVGLCALLNSQLFDTYFRIFNGNVNVSATELREMTLPPLETIKEIGNIIILSNDFSIEHVNKIVSESLEITTATYEQD